MARMIFCRLPNRSTMRSMTASGRRGILAQQPVAARLQPDVEVDGARAEVQRRGDRLEVEQVVGVELGQRAERLLEVALGVLVEVVLDHEAAVVVDAAHELLELQAHEPAVVAELDDVSVDLLGDAAHHLGALQHGDDVAERDEVLDLERRRAGLHRVEPVLVALERRQRLVGPVEQPRDRLERVLLVADVDGDHLHVLGHRDHRHGIERATRSAVRCRVPVSDVGHVRVRARGARWPGRCGWRRRRG